MNLNELKSKSKTLEPIIRIGKNGLTESQLKEIIKHLKSKKLIKIKLLKSCIENYEKQEIINEVVAKTNSKLILQIGNTFTIAKVITQKPLTKVNI